MAIEAGSSTYYQAKRGIVQDGLVLHLDAGVKESYPRFGNTWYDLSGNNNHGTLINGVGYNRNNGGGLVFDGVNDRAEVVYSANNFINTNFTWSVWILGTVISGTPMPIIGYGSGGWPRLGFSLRSPGWHFGQYGANGAGNVDIYFDVQPSLTNWLELTVVADYTNTNIKAYTNGILKYSLNQWRDSTGNYSTLGLGRAGSTSWPNGLLQGSLSEFKIYNRALSADEVRRNYNATKHRFNLT